jgi:hypothetical protein
MAVALLPERECLVAGEQGRASHLAASTRGGGCRMTGSSARSPRSGGENRREKIQAFFGGHADDA